jgi:hypothetical protein
MTDPAMKRHAIVSFVEVIFPPVRMLLETTAALLGNSETRPLPIVSPYTGRKVSKGKLDKAPRGHIG